MQKNYNYNYVNRVAKAKDAIEYLNVGLASCTKKVLDSEKVTDGKLWHATDENKFYFDWNGKRTELNLTGSSSDLTAEIEKIKVPEFPHEE